jgi:hypothetical protein
MPDQDFGIDLSDWKTLTPAQQSALVLLLVRRAHTARNHAVGKALIGAMGALCGGWSQVLPAAALAASARWLAPRGKDF